MAFNGLSEFVNILDQQGLLLRIKQFVDPVYEVAEITDRISKQEGGGKAILFENTGTSYPILTNALGSRKRIELALGGLGEDLLIKEIDDFFQNKENSEVSIIQYITKLFNTPYTSKQHTNTVSGRGDCQQIIDLEPNLSKFPIPKSWLCDGGAFLTQPLIHSKSPITGNRYIGTNRIQVFSSNLMGMHWPKYYINHKIFNEYKKLGQHMPIAVVLGGDPIYTIVARAQIPENSDPFTFAGFLRRRAVKLVKGITVDIEVPYDAEIVIEGYVDPNEEQIWEGPFGCRTGFYSLASWQPKFYVTCITHRSNAILPILISGVPPSEEDLIDKALEKISLGLIRSNIAPDVVDLNIINHGGSQNTAIVKINKTYPGQASRVANALWGSPQLMLNKFMVVVSSNVDIHKPDEVLKTVSKHYNPVVDTYFNSGPADALDHSSVKLGIGGKLLIDASEKFQEEQSTSSHFEASDSEILAELLADKELPITGFSNRLISQGVLLVSIDKSIGVSGRTVANSIVRRLELSLPKFIVIVDKEIKLDDITLVYWYAAYNADPACDCFFVDIGGKHTPCLVLDGTRKSFAIDNHPNDWPNLVMSSNEVINAIDIKWSSLGVEPFLPSPSLKFLNLQIGEGAIIR